jgi:S1-C subfamily serine protease
LNHLATLQEARGQDLAALNCLVAALSLDRANPRTLAHALPLLKKHQFTQEAEQLSRLSSAVPLAARPALPKLPQPGELKKLSAAEVYQKAAWSVVLIKGAKGSGSGVCVGRPDIILTNYHVIEGDGPIDVHPFILKEKVPVRMPKIRATVLFQSAREDLAILQLAEAPGSLKALDLAAADPAPGTKVFALGSPGLGNEVLDQSISEGLVSSTRRTLGGVRYLQHSAAVNPGNSGGPLLDEGGRVVGLVTWKAHLENVSFAIPAATIRTVFKSP